MVSLKWLTILWIRAADSRSVIYEKNPIFCIYRPHIPLIEEKPSISPSFHQIEVPLTS